MTDAQEPLVRLPDGAGGRSTADLNHVLLPVFTRVNAVETQVNKHVGTVDAKMAELVAKVNKVAKQAGLVGKLGAEMRELADKLEEVAAAQAEAEAAAKVPPWDWSAMSPKQMRDAFGVIAGWLDSTGRMFGLLEPPQAIAHQLGAAAERPGGAIRPCWFRHWDVVMELGWLVQIFQQAYSGPNATIRAVADFHDRYLGSTVERLYRTSTMRECKGGEHRDPYDPRRGLATGQVDKDSMTEYLDRLFTAQQG